MDLLTMGAVGDPSLSEKMGPWPDAGDVSPVPPHQVDAADAIVELSDEDGFVLARAVGDCLKYIGDAGPLARGQRADRIGIPSAGGALLTPDL